VGCFVYNPQTSQVAKNSDLPTLALWGGYHSHSHFVKLDLPTGFSGQTNILYQSVLGDIINSWVGGKNSDNLISLCIKCHNRFDNLLRDFWKSGEDSS
jgi:5-methylcytosine-specific restriction endonuclease McrA